MPWRLYINLMSTLGGVRGNTLPPYKSFGGNKIICKVTLSHPVFGPPLTPIPSFIGIRKLKTLINLSMKCCNSAYNAQGSRLIIVVVLRSSENICSYSGGRVAQEQWKTGWNSVSHQNWWFSEFHPPLNANVLFCKFFFNLTLCMTKFRVLMLCFSYFTDNSNSFRNIT